VNALEEIKSKDNKLVKHIKKLNAKKYREENNEFMVEGLRFVEEALRFGATIKYCFYSRSLQGDRVQGVHLLVEAVSK
jgi:TrmH family RNA methyltransferase